MFPIRCYTCNSVLADKHVTYSEGLRTGKAASAMLDKLDVQRMCCRRMFLGFVDLTAEQIHYGNVNTVIEHECVVLKRHIASVREHPCV